MIISDNNISDERLIHNPIFLLTGDEETTRFYSSLCSASIKLGYFIEDLIFERIKLPLYYEINQPTLFFDEKYILKKPKFGSEIPEFVVVDEIKKTIDVYEIKTNLRNADSKKAHGEKLKYSRLYDFLVDNYSNYSIAIYVVDFLGTMTGATTLYKESKILRILTGEEFCKLIDIDYFDMMNQITDSRNKNIDFIRKYKSIAI